MGTGLVAAFACVFLTAIVGYFLLTGGEAKTEDSPRQAQLRALRERKLAIYDNLKDLHFEYLAGKVNAEDYRKGRSALEQEAAQVSEQLAGRA
ncbi:MAG: hypothetical protein ACRD2F_15570 [Terriglobales bacterium]